MAHISSVDLTSVHCLLLSSLATMHMTLDVISLSGPLGDSALRHNGRTGLSGPGLWSLSNIASGGIDESVDLEAGLYPVLLVPLRSQLKHSGKAR